MKVYILLLDVIFARYVRINPQSWKRDLCLRTEIYGCPYDANKSKWTTTSVDIIFCPTALSTLHIHHKQVPVCQDNFYRNKIVSFCSETATESNANLSDALTNISEILREELGPGTQENFTKRFPNTQEDMRRLKRLFQDLHSTGSFIKHFQKYVLSTFQEANMCYVCELKTRKHEATIMLMQHWCYSWTEYKAISYPNLFYSQAFLQSALDATTLTTLRVAPDSVLILHLILTLSCSTSVYLLLLI